MHLLAQFSGVSGFWVQPVRAGAVARPGIWPPSRCAWWEAEAAPARLAPGLSALTWGALRLGENIESACGTLSEGSNNAAHPESVAGALFTRTKIVQMCFNPLPRI